MKRLLIAVIALLSIADAQAATYTGADLMRHCRGTQEERGYCTGYVGGVADMLISCMTERSPKTHLEAVQVVAAWLEANPSRQKSPAFWVVMRALAEPDCVLPGRKP